MHTLGGDARRRQPREARQYGHRVTPRKPRRCGFHAPTLGRGPPESQDRDAAALARTAGGRGRVRSVPRSPARVTVIGAPPTPGGPDLMAVPDLHGRMGLLRALLNDYPGRRFVFLGDALDYGNEVPAVVGVLLALHAAGRATLLLGNHELMAAQAARGDPADGRLWLTSGGAATIRAYVQGGDANLERYQADLNALLRVSRPYLIEGGVLFAHAARPDAPALMGGPSERHYWAAPSQPLEPLPEGVYLSVHGHSPRPAPLLDWDRGVAYLDLGGRGMAVLDCRDWSLKVISSGARGS